MATRVSRFSARQLPIVSSVNAGNVVVNDFFIDLKANEFPLNDLIDLGVLPANHSIVDAILIPDDLDTNATPLLSMDVGLMSGEIGDATSVRTVGAELFSGSIAARTGVVERMTLKSGFLVRSSDKDRSIGVKITAAAATAAAGRLRLRLLIDADPVGVQF